MKILWVATKAPWPPRDGGRLVLWNTLRALHDAGHRLELIAPVWEGARETAEIEGQLGAWCTPRLVGERPRGAAAAVLRSWLSGEPWTVERHRLPALQRVLDSALNGEPRDVVVAEQLQALAQADPVRRRWPRGAAGDRRGGPLLVLRAQNVESDLWSASADAASGLRAAWLRAQARRLRRAEGEAVARVDAVVALTAADAATLRALRPLSALTETGARDYVRAVAAPFDLALPAAGRVLSGAPAIALLGSSGWVPNEQQARWFARSVWPEVQRRCPAARLHVFGAAVSQRPGIELHAAPAESRDGFAPGSILVVPLEVASGVRMKILEAWSRGVPVVASPAAVAGLEVGSESALAVARTPGEWADAVACLAADPGLFARRIAAGREVLARCHAPALVARQWTDLLAGLRGESR